MALVGYEKALDWVPDSTYVNDPMVSTIEYYAWKIGISRDLALWTFYPAVDTPTQDLEVDILGNDFKKFTIEQDTPVYGFNRTFLLKKTIAELESTLTDAFVDIDNIA